MNSPVSNFLPDIFLFDCLADEVVKLEVLACSSTINAYLLPFRFKSAVIEI